MTEPAREELNLALLHAESIMRDGRERVRDLRSPSPESDGLTASLESVGTKFEALTRIPFTIMVRGKLYTLKPLVEEEVILIAREAITNAYKHAKARSVQAGVRYSRFFFTLSIFDDGQGIEPETLSRGYKPEHWGLTGMRERAQRPGARFYLRQPKSGGTQVELRISARVAYLKSVDEQKQSAAFEE